MSTTETGHARIMANVKRLIAVLLNLGMDYKPSNSAIMVEAFQNSVNACLKAIDAVGTAILAFRAACRQRELAFEQLSKLATRIFNTLKASDRTGKSHETAKLYVRKIQGRRATPKRSEEEKKADLESGISYTEVSASQMSYDSRVENFAMLVMLAASTPNYAPNETDLKSESLNAVLEDLRNKNAAVTSATADLFKARALRNKLMYAEATGIVDMAMDAKTYLKGAFGTNSSQFKEVSGILFKKLSRN